MAVAKVVNNKINWAGNTNLIILGFSTAFYGRIFCSVTRAPSILVHAHFIVVIFLLWITLTTTKTKDPKQIRLVLAFLLRLLIFLIATLASAFWNTAGLINAIISFIMLGEPMMFLIAVICIPMSLKSFTRVKKLFLWSLVINFVLATFQKPLIDAGKLYADGLNGTDGCGGVFFVSGAGNYVSASVSFAFAIYFLISEKTCALWIRITVILAAFWQVLYSDSKQLVLAYLVSWILLILFTSTDIKKSFSLLIGIVVICSVFYWCVQNVKGFESFTAWARPELYGPDGEAWYAKFYSIRVIMSKFQSPFDWLFGLGPGHTVSRLGAWFLQDYWSILEPLGATTSYIGPESRQFVKDFWLTLASSLFSPIFAWAGIWGDLGILGLSSYLFLAHLVWQHFGINNSLKITLLCILVLGFIFTQLEEPGYMLSISMMLGLAWQEKRLKLQQYPQLI
jgi:hypothetical protein